MTKWAIVQHKTADPPVRYYVPWDVWTENREAWASGMEGVDVEIRPVRNVFYDTEDFTPEQAQPSGVFPGRAMWHRYRMVGEA